MYEPINPRLRLILLGLGLISILGIGIWISPRGLSIYYQTRGGQLLEDVIASDGALANGIACEKPPLTNKDSLTKVTQVISDLQKAIQYNAINSMAYLQLGRAYCLLGEHEKAIEDYKNFIVLRPENPLGHLELGFAYEAICRKNIQERQEYGPLKDLRLCYDADLLSKTLEEWQFYAKPLYFVGNGKSAFNSGDYKDAIEWYKRARELGTDLESAIWYTLALENRDNDAVRNYDLALEKSIKIDHGWVDPETRFMAWYDWGRLLTEQERYEEAKGVLQKTVGLYPNKPYLQKSMSEVYRLLGGAYWNTGSLEEAKRYLEKSVDLNTSNVWAHIHYGKVIYLYSQQRAGETEKEFAVALNLAKDELDIWENIMLFWIRNGEKEKAEKLCQQAREEKIVGELNGLCNR